MVRLKLNQCATFPNATHEFQFLNGAIKMDNVEGRQIPVKVFQFLNGAIKILHPDPPIFCFYTFQFLNGAIKIL